MKTTTKTNKQTQGKRAAAPQKGGTKETKGPEKKAGTKPAASAGAGTLSAGVEAIPKQELDVAVDNIFVWYNARTSRNPEKQAQLEKSVKERGVLTRLWVFKPSKPGPKGEEYGLIAGEGRWTGAKKAPFLTVPVVAYECDDKKAEELGLIDNLQREDLDEIDAAFGYKRLIDEHGMVAWDEKDLARSVGHKMGLSKTAIYAALKLTTLCQKGVKAVRNKQLSPSVATRLARIPDPKLQGEAVERAIMKGWTDDEAAAQIEERYMKELKGAPFDREDATLVPERGACGGCTYRSGNQKELFPEFARGRGDICLLPTCYRQKCQAGFQRRAAAHEAKGGKVLTAEQAERAGLHSYGSYIGGLYVSLDAPAAGAGEHKKTWRQLLAPMLKDGRFVPDLAMANDGTGAHFELAPSSTLVKCATELGVNKLAADLAASREKHRAEKAAQKVADATWPVQLKAIVEALEELPREREAAVMEDWLPLVAVGLAGLTGNAEAKQIVERRGLEVVKLDRWEWEAEKRTVQAYAAGLNLPQLMGFIVEVVLLAQRQKPEEERQTAAFAGLAGVSLPKIAEQVRLAMEGKNGGKKSKDQTPELPGAEEKFMPPAEKGWRLWEQLTMPEQAEIERTFEAAGLKVDRVGQQFRKVDLKPEEVKEDEQPWAWEWCEIGEAPEEGPALAEAVG